MRKLLLLFLLAVTAMSASAVTCKYDKLNKSKKTCRICGWSGNEPSNGKIKLKDSYTVDNVTYTVTEIAPNALNNLVSVIEIIIPASIVKIGDIDAVEPSIGAEKGSLKNFMNCHALEKFNIDKDNPVFASNDNGWLLNKKGRNLYRVPASAACDAGELKISNYIHYIFADAFVGNSKATKITLSSGLKAFYPTCGLHRMTSVTEFAVGVLATATKVIDGVLFNGTGTYLYAYPAKKEGEKYTVPSSVSHIGEYAFAHNRTLRTVSQTSVRKISEHAFEDAIYLYTYQGPAPERISRRAFYNAINLSTFPMSASTCLDGDSIFFGTGFTTIRFDDDIYLSNNVANRYTFSDSRLNVIEMDKITLGGNNSDDAYQFYSDFASGCQSLVKVTLPKRCVFKKDKGRPAFYGGFNMQNIITGSFRVEGDNVPFVFPVHNSTNIALRIFTATRSSKADIDKYAPWGLLIDFSGTGGISPYIYTDMKKPYAPNAESKYVYRTSKGYATYYVPGLCAPNYQEAKDVYCPVREMYDIEVIDRGGNAVVKLKKNESFLNFGSIIINGDNQIKITGDGEYNTGNPISQLQTVEVTYSVIIPSPYFRGPGMSTTYTREDFGLSGIEAVADDLNRYPVEYYDMHGIKVDRPSHGVYIRRQGDKVTKVMVK